MAQRVRTFVLKFYTLTIVLGLKQIQKLVFENIRTRTYRTLQIIQGGKVS